MNQYFDNSVTDKQNQDTETTADVICRAYQEASNLEYIGIGRIHIEFFDDEHASRGYKDKYGLILQEFSKKLHASPHFTPGCLDSFFEESWRIFRFEMGTAYGSTPTICESLDSNNWDCDNSAFLIYDLAKILGFNVEMVAVPKHALLKIGSTYFETTTGELLSIETFRQRYAEIEWESNEPAIILTIVKDIVLQRNWEKIPSIFKSGYHSQTEIKNSYILSIINGEFEAAEQIRDLIEDEDISIQIIENYLRGRPDNVLSLLKNLSNHKQQEPHLTEIYSEALILTNAENALIELRSNAKNSPDDSMTNYWLAMAEYCNGKLNEAQKTIRLSLWSNYDNHRAQFLRLKIINRLDGEVSEALQCVNAAVSVNNQTLVSKSRFDDDKIIRDDMFATYHSEVGQVFLTLDTNLAVSAFTCQKAILPDLAIADLGLAKAYQLLNKLDVAQSHFHQALDAFGSTKPNISFEQFKKLNFIDIRKLLLSSYNSIQKSSLAERVRYLYLCGEEMLAAKLALSFQQMNKSSENEQIVHIGAVLCSLFSSICGKQLLYNLHKSKHQLNFCPIWIYSEALSSLDDPFNSQIFNEFSENSRVWLQSFQKAGLLNAEDCHINYNNFFPHDIRVLKKIIPFRIDAENSKELLVRISKFHKVPAALGVQILSAFAFCNFELGEYEKGKAIILNGYQYYPDDFTLHLAMAYISKVQGLTDEYEKFFMLADQTSEGKTNPGQNMRKIDRFIEQGKLNEGLAYCLSIFSRFEAFAPYWSYLSSLYCMLGNINEAKLAIRRGNRRMQDHPRWLFFRDNLIQNFPVLADYNEL